MSARTWYATLAARYFDMLIAPIVAIHRLLSVALELTNLLKHDHVRFERFLTYSLSVKDSSKVSHFFQSFFFYLIWFNKSALGIGSKFRSLMYFVSLHSSASKSPNSVWTRQLAIWAIIDSAHVRFACRISRLIERQNKWRVNSSWSCSHGSDG